MIRNLITVGLAVLSIAGCATITPAEEARQHENCRAFGGAAVAAMPPDHTAAQAAIEWNAANAQCEDRLAQYKRDGAQQDAATASNVLVGISAAALAIIGIAAIVQPQPVTYIVVQPRHRH